MGGREKEPKQSIFWERERVPISQYIWTFGVEISLGVMAVEFAKQAPLLKKIVHTHMWVPWSNDYGPIRFHLFAFAAAANTTIDLHTVPTVDFGYCIAGEKSLAKQALS